MLWLMILLIIALITVAIILSTQFFNILFRGFAPFISSRPEVIQKILSELKIKEEAIVYELGCGKAGFLRAMEEKYPRTKLIGIEYNLLPYLIAQIQINLHKSKIKIWRKNLFRVNLAKADLIYCYLNQKMMKKLEIKFKEECQSGTKVISYAFTLPTLTPEKVIELENKSKIYFYTILKPQLV